MTSTTDNLALAGCVKANLAMNPDTSELQFEVAAQAGSISIKSGIDTPDQTKKICSFVRNIFGVHEAVLKELSLVTRLGGRPTRWLFPPVIYVRRNYGLTGAC